MAVIKNGLLHASVAHARIKPARNSFLYDIFYLALSLSALDKLAGVRGMGLERFSLFSFYGRDHGQRRNGQNLEGWVRGILARFGVTTADGEIVLVTLPRVLGYVFNPVSFWFCLDRDGGLRTVLSEVNNTFGDSHSYISFHDDQRVITQNDILEARKVMHVSPFMHVKGRYTFRFVCNNDRIGAWIDYYDGDDLLLTTSVAGKRCDLDASGLLRAFWRYPLVTLKVIFLIHYQALRLWLKGVAYVPRPKPPQEEVTR